MKLLVTVLMIASWLAAGAGPAAGDDDTREQDLALVKKLGGKVEIDEGAAGRPVVGLDLGFTRASDDDLARFAPFEQLRRLDLFRTPVTDAGMARLTQFPHLRSLV